MNWYQMTFVASEIMIMIMLWLSIKRTPVTDHDQVSAGEIMAMLIIAICSLIMICYGTWVIYNILRLL